MTAAPDFGSLAQRLEEAADRLAEDLPEGVLAPQFLEGDPSLDEVDAYYVNLMREAAGAAGAMSGLLAALNQFVAHYPPGINPFLDDAARMARAAILKATGASL